MRHLLISLILLLFFSGCEDKEQQAREQAAHDAKIAQQARAELLAELQAKKDFSDNNASKLHKMGIHMEEGTITIDTNKTKDFFRALNQKMGEQMKKLSDDMKKGMVETKEAGIEINEQHIHIDLNKTHDMLINWGKQIQVFVEEFDEMAKTLETNNTNTTMKGI
ncbi:hypothetical protein [Sulfurovum sp. AR]|uniref:hypothetical protein n=1 Tax=Sulfurovum sp. AR TaxID=1165841 RepID=UPI00025C4843|nr:hypothetical protein [Sulfurovum sp. AR]EIF50442.1 hypothetical protein SULAR_08167 [Sulfurovum sp. AR]